MIVGVEFALVHQFLLSIPNRVFHYRPDALHRGACGRDTINSHVVMDLGRRCRTLIDFLDNMPNDPMGYLVFDELDKTASRLLLGQVGSYFVRTKAARARSRLIIPEPFFVHSDLTTLVQLAGIIAYTISWDLRLTGMAAPAREELRPIADRVRALCFRHETESRTL